MTAVVDELGASADEPFDPRHDLDVAGADPVECADVEHRRPALGVLELQRAPWMLRLSRLPRKRRVIGMRTLPTSRSGRTRHARAP